MRRYLSDRGISRDLAQRYCDQLNYRLHGKDYYAIGFENNNYFFTRLRMWFIVTKSGRSCAASQM